jgi:paraquat-inducible protein A
MTLGGRRFLLSMAILAAAVCLALGISLPIIKLTKFVFFTYEHSLLSTVQSLLTSGQHLLGLTVLLFSIVLPVLKLFYLLLLATLPISELRRWKRQLHALEWLGKWSMHDVLVLSLTIFFIKSQGVYDARSLNGIYFFTAAVLFMILAYAWLKADVEGEGRVDAVKILDQAPPPRSAPLRNFILSFLIILATVFFALGIILPAVRFTTAYVWKNEHSIASILWALYQNDELFLCIVIGVFSIVFPFFKLLYLLTLLTSPDMSHEFRVRSMAAMEWLGRYSMTDVMVLALIIFYFNASGYTAAQPLSGIYFFMASTLMTMFAYGWANSFAPRPKANRPTLVASETSRVA